MADKLRRQKDVIKSSLSKKKFRQMHLKKKGNMQPDGEQRLYLKAPMTFEW